MKEQKGKWNQDECDAMDSALNDCYQNSQYTSYDSFFKNFNDWKLVAEKIKNITGKFRSNKQCHDHGKYHHDPTHGNHSLTFDEKLCSRIEICKELDLILSENIDWEDEEIKKQVKEAYNRYKMTKIQFSWSEISKKTGLEPTKIKNDFLSYIQLYHSKHQEKTVKKKTASKKKIDWGNHEIAILRIAILSTLKKELDDLKITITDQDDWNDDNIKENIKNATLKFLEHSSFSWKSISDSLESKTRQEVKTCFNNYIGIYQSSKTKKPARKKIKTSRINPLARNIGNIYEHKFTLFPLHESNAQEYTLDTIYDPNGLGYPQSSE